MQIFNERREANERQAQRLSCTSNIETPSELRRHTVEIAYMLSPLYTFAHI